MRKGNIALAYLYPSERGDVVNSVAIVTGASQGIGRSTAIRLARDFSSIVLAARNANALKEVAATVKSAGAEPLICELDLSKIESAETLVKAALDRFGRIDALLNIAGAVPQIDLFEMTDEQWRAGMELKLRGARRLTILAWQSLKASNGAVVFMSGSAALDPKPGFGPLQRRMPLSLRWRRPSLSKASKMEYRSIALCPVR
jgi:3-oxoacyl-[acyl-carrier protein] reductase